MFDPGRKSLKRDDEPGESRASVHGALAVGNPTCDSAPVDEDGLVTGAKNRVGQTNQTP